MVRHLIHAGHDVHVVTGAPDFVFTTEIQSPRLFIRKVSLFVCLFIYFLSLKSLCNAIRKAVLII